MFSNDAFVRFLAERLNLTESDLPRLSKWSRTGNTIEALSLRLNLLTVEQIDRILESQEADGRLFSEIAVELGFLSDGEIGWLLEIQRLNELIELGEQLVVSGKVDAATLITQLGQFLDQSGSRSETSKTDAAPSEASSLTVEAATL